MVVSLSSRGIGAVVLAVGLALAAGCSSDSDVPQTTVSAPDGGTKVNTDTGSGGNFPDVNTVPTQRPTSTIQDLAQAPEGLAGARTGTQYGEALVGGPTSSAAPPPPPPPPPQEELAPIPEAGIKTETSGASPAGPSTAPAQTYVEPVGSAAPAEMSAASNEPIATPEVAEPEPMEPVAGAAPAPTAPEGQMIQGTTAQPAAPTVAAPQPAPAPVTTPQPVPSQPQAALPPASAPAPSPAAPQQAQLPASAPASGYRASAPEAYGITPPQPVAAPSQPYNPAPAAPGYANYGQPPLSRQPFGLIYFGDGSSEVPSDGRDVLKQMADIQRAYGGVVNVVGHASMGGGTTGYEANQRISEARAIAVARQLMSYGVPQSAIRASAVGASQPLYSEAVPNGEAANRRVEVYLTAY
ncbi:OmpA family protein [Dongia deserti]|uniref:OmpA family protein n=1 Tax=Dongia deserti TaxID=2268030 RepID=UPI0013C4A12E|nr:OmpA family protein [Dongia deserti]